MNPREQGDWGELSAMSWLSSKGATVAIPVFHSPNWDLIAEMDGRLLRVEVKTCTCRSRGRWAVSICTRGGNQSWNGLVKKLDPTKYDYLFVLVADGRRWFIPSSALGGGRRLLLGGPKYAAFEVERGDPIPAAAEPEPSSRIDPAASRGDARVAKGAGL